MLDCFCRQARRASRLLTAHYEAAFATVGLTAPQFELLRTLSVGKSMNGRTLAQYMSVDVTTLSRNLKVLLRDGLIDAAQSPKDAREQIYKLTTKGKARLTKAIPLWEKSHTDIEKFLGEDAAVATRILQKLGTLQS